MASVEKKDGVLPPPRRQLVMEIESYNRQIKALNQKGNPSLYQDEVNFCKGEIMIRLDHYGHATGSAYEKYSDVGKNEKNQAIQLFEGLRGHSWKKKFGWTGQSKTSIRPMIKTYEAELGLCDGIDVSRFGNAYILSGIELTNNGCEGTIPEGLKRLGCLKTFNINLNNISGSVPSDLGECENLEYLNASGNILSGSLDDSFIRSFQTIRCIDLSFNKLEGVLPDAFGTLSKLQDLNLAGNNFEGVLPPSMSALINLRQLKLYSNHFCGDLPDYLSRMDKLLEINLSNNSFSGSFDPLTGCTRLKKICLSHNSLNKPLTENISALKCLELLYIDNNLIEGIIPPEICGLSALKFLNISNNSIEGRIPEDFGNLLGLRVCLLSKNHICGPIPRTISKLKNLREFHVFASLPAGSMTLHEGFKKNNFERVYCWGGKVGIDNVSWEPHGMDDIGNVFNPNSLQAKKKSKEAVNITSKKKKMKRKKKKKDETQKETNVL